MISLKRRLSIDLDEDSMKKLENNSEDVVKEIRCLLEDRCYPCKIITEVDEAIDDIPEEDLNEEVPIDIEDNSE